MSDTVQRVVLNLNDIRALQAASGVSRRTLKALQALPQDMLPEVAKIVQVRSIDPLIYRLRMYPPRAVYPIAWKSEKQRRYVLMMLRRQENLPYQRTGNLARGWRGTAKPTRRSSVRIEVENIAAQQGERYAQFVGGRIGVGTSPRSMRRYLEPMQPFHKNTGWQPFAPLVARYYRDALKEAKTVYSKRIQRMLRTL